VPDVPLPAVLQPNADQHEATWYRRGYRDAMACGPSAAQWARAKALREAREWASVMFGIETVNEPEEALETAELLALRWARLIETGEGES
jgi:hypothetical protein